MRRHLFETGCFYITRERERREDRADHCCSIVEVRGGRMTSCITHKTQSGFGISWFISKGTDFYPRPSKTKDSRGRESWSARADRRQNEREEGSICDFNNQVRSNAMKNHGRWCIVGDGHLSYFFLTFIACNSM